MDHGPFQVGFSYNPSVQGMALYIPFGIQIS